MEAPRVIRVTQDHKVTPLKNYMLFPRCKTTFCLEPSAEKMHRAIPRVGQGVVPFHA